MIQSNSPFAIVTGVSGRIGFALAERCAANGFDLLITSPESDVAAIADRLRDQGVSVDPVRVDLDSADGVDELCDIVRVLGRPVDALVTGAGVSPGRSFLDQDFDPMADALDVGVLGPLRLTHRIGRDMRHRGRGRILIAAAANDADAAGMAVTCGANAFLAGFAVALREELKETGVSVTYLSPQPTAGAEGCNRSRASHDAHLGFDAMMRGEMGLSSAGAAAIALAAGCVPDRAEPQAVALEPQTFET